MDKEIEADEQPLQGYYPLEVQAAQFKLKYPGISREKIFTHDHIFLPNVSIQQAVVWHWQGIFFLVFERKELYLFVFIDFFCFLYAIL